LYLYFIEFNTSVVKNENEMIFRSCGAARIAKKGVIADLP